MCFPIGEIKVAKKDIIVWKMFRKSGNKILTPYQNTPISEVKSKKVILAGDSGYCSFAREQKRYARYTNRILIKMCIPKGSRYGKGIYVGNSTMVAYRSERLIGSKQRGKK